MNTGTFAGYLGRDAESRKTPSGHDVLNFSVAVTVGFGDNQKTLWVGCALWGDRGEKLGPYLTKGKAVCVSGDVDIRSYEARDGKTQSELTLNVQRVTMLGGRKQEYGQRSTEKPVRQEWAKEPTRSAKDDFDDDIPFIWAFALPIAGLLCALISSSSVIA
jgi:single-strand DNA-binding protein